MSEHEPVIFFLIIVYKITVFVSKSLNTETVLLTSKSRGVGKKLLAELCTNMAKTTKVAKVGVKREGGYLYFVDKNGDVSRAPMKKSGKRGGKAKVAKVGVKKRKGYMYFIDGAGDISEVAMSRSGAKRKKERQFISIRET